MKSLGVILIFCLGVTVKAAAFIDDTNVAINVTLIPFNETTPGAQTLNPASDKTVSAATMPPATGQTDTAPTIKPMTTGSPIPVSIITIEPTTPATIVPIVTTLSTFPTVNPTSAPKTHGFDGASFGGGFALGFGLCIIFIIGYVLYSRRRNGGYSTM